MEKPFKQIEIPEKYNFTLLEIEVIKKCQFPISYNELCKQLKVPKHKIERALRIIYYKLGIKTKAQLTDVTKEWQLTPLEQAEREWEKIEHKIVLNRSNTNLAKSYWNKAWVRADEVYNKKNTGESV